MKQTRRAYLASGAIAVGTAGLAGCLGNGNDDDDSDESAAAETSHECEIADSEPVSELPQPRVGPDDAEITVDVFEDFGCPGCRDFALGPLADLKGDYSDEVQFEHYDFPIPASNWSVPLANAARHIQDEYDDETFFEFNIVTYENFDDHSWQLIGDLAEDVGADPCAVLSDAANETYSEVLASNFEEGQQREIPVTPTVFVDSQEVEASYEDVEAAIENAR